MTIAAKTDRRIFQLSQVLCAGGWAGGASGHGGSRRLGPAAGSPGPGRGPRSSSAVLRSATVPEDGCRRATHRHVQAQETWPAAWGLQSCQHRRQTVLPSVHLLRTAHPGDVRRHRLWEGEGVIYFRLELKIFKICNVCEGFLATFALLNPSLENFVLFGWCNCSTFGRLVFRLLTE